MRMKYSLVCLNKVSFMKRFLLSSVLLLAMGGAASAYENDIVLTVPPMDPALVQIDDPLFINNGAFTVVTPLIFIGGTANPLFTTSSTLDYTNNGTLTCEPGMDFETFPASAGQAHMANSFVNNANGFGGGVITANNVWGLNIFQQGGVDGPPAPVNADIVGLAMVKVRATNVVNTGLITMDNTGLIDIVGKSVDMRHGRLLMTGIPTVDPIDGGAGGLGTNTVPSWQPASQLSPNSASTPAFTNFTGLTEQLSVFGSTAYFQNTSPAVDATGMRVWRIIFLEDTSPTNVSTQVFFGNSAFDNGAFHIQWTGTYRDLRTDQTATNYYLFSDVPEVRRDRTGAGLIPVAGVLPEFSFNSGPTSFLTGAPAAPAFVPDPFPAVVTNDFGFISVIPQSLPLGTNQIIGGSATNLPGRIQLTSLDSLALDDSTASGMSYVQLNTPNFLGNSNSYIAAPYADINLGVTNGSLNVSNLLAPYVPEWTTASGTFGGGLLGTAGITAFSGSYFFTETNFVVVPGTPPTTNAITITNDVRILIVSSSLQPTSPTFQKDIVIHAANSLVINDALNIYDNFTSDTTSLTVATNAGTAYSTFGTLLIQPPLYNWSPSLPNLQYLTNWGIITTSNQGNFAGNMPSFLSPRSQATPYQAFVNHGQIVNQGIFVDANYFENSGSIVENGAAGLFGGVSGSAGIDIRSSTATSTNGSLIATNGPISIAANSLFISNSVVNSGRTLTFNTPCFLSDGYAFGNQFGHATNTTPLNVVTNGNFFTTAGGVQMLANPASGDLLGTTITNISVNSLVSMNVWAGDDRGASPAGFAENTALGRMIFTSDGNPSQFSFRGLNNNNALYVDSIEFQGNATNTDADGNFLAFTIQPGMKIYYAQALMNGVSVAEKLNGKNGGGFVWVSNYAGVYSSTNLSGTIYNEALVISPNLDSDNDGTVNRDDTTPIPAGLTFDVANAGPQACGGGGGNGNNPPPDGGGSTNGTPQAPGKLAFPQQQTSSGGGVSFAAAQGSYNGLFYETNGVNPASSGFFTAKLNSRGTFSAKLQLGNGTYSFTKTFDSNGNITTFVQSKKLAALKVTLHLVNNDQITGEVSEGSDWTAELLALNSVKNASAFGTGKHSLVLSVNDTNSTTDSGDCFGTMTLSKNGSIQWNGVLPDGGNVSQKSALSVNGVWPLYSSTASGKGSLIGWLQLTNGSSDIGGSAVWIVPANQSSLYRNGLTNELDASGSDVVAPPAGTRKTIILSSPQLASPLTNSVTISGKSGQSGNNSLTLSVDAKNGLFSGSVLDPNSNERLSFQGALLEKSGVGGGFFLNPNKDQGGKVSLAPAN